MFHIDVDLDIFEKGHRLKRHLEKLGGKLDGVPFTKAPRLIDLYMDVAIKGNVVSHCQYMEMGDPLRSHSPEIDFQMLYLYLNEGGDLSRMQTLSPGSSGIRDAVEINVRQEGWASLDETFKDPLCEESKILQQQVARFMLEKDMAARKLYYHPHGNTMRSGDFVHGAMVSAFLAVCSGQPELPEFFSIEVERLNQRAIQVLVGTTREDLGYECFDHQAITEASQMIRSLPYFKKRSYASSMKSLDFILDTLSKHFVATWCRKGVSLKQLHRDLIRRVRALCAAFGTPDAFDDYPSRSACFRAFFSHKHEWRELGVEWQHGLGISLDQLRVHKSPDTSVEGVMNPYDEWPRMSTGVLSSRDNSRLFQKTLEALLDGTIKPEIYANHIGAYLPSASLMTCDKGLAAMAALVAHSRYLSLIIPEGLHSDLAVERHAKSDVYCRVLEAIGLKVMAGKSVSSIRIGRQAKPVHTLIGWVREHDPLIIRRAFINLARRETESIGLVMNLFDIKASDFSSDEIATFGQASRRALISQSMNI